MEFLSILAAARQFAVEAHEGQTYGFEEHPYEFHLDAVRDVALEFGITDPDIVVATLLHDTLEDTHTSYTDLANMFGYGVANLVEAVSGRSGNRRERNAQQYKKILELGERAVLLKLCDRIANVRYGVRGDDIRHLEMYSKEYEHFRSMLYSKADTLAMPLWRELDALLLSEKE